MHLVSKELCCREYERQEHPDDDNDEPPESENAPKEVEKRSTSSREQRESRDLFDDIPDKKVSRDSGWDEPERCVAITLVFLKLQSVLGLKRMRMLFETKAFIYCASI